MSKQQIAKSDNRKREDKHDKGKREHRQKERNLKKEKGAKGKGVRREQGQKRKGPSSSMLGQGPRELFGIKVPDGSRKFRESICFNLMSTR